MSKRRPRLPVSSAWLPSQAAKARLDPCFAIVALIVVVALLGAATANRSYAHDIWNPSLLISEVHPVADSDGTPLQRIEWVELHNAGVWPVNLDGWFIEDATAFSLLPDIEIPPDGTVVVVGGGSEIAVPGGRTLIVLESSRIGNGLRNSGDRVALVDPYGTRRDAVSWGDQRWPYSLPAPEAGQSITRTEQGRSRLSDDITPWTVEQSLRKAAPRDSNNQHNTTVAIVSLNVNPLDGESAHVTIQNLSDQPLLTVNWMVSVGNSSEYLPSVRLEPDERRSFSAAEIGFSSDFSSRGGSIVLRDPEGFWLSTASWGTNELFHSLSPLPAGVEIRLSNSARIRPRTAWHQRFQHHQQSFVSSEDGQQLVASNISLTQERLPSIWISEVYPAAGQGRNDPAFEWFELTNHSDTDVSLGGWTVVDNTASDALDGAVVPAGGSLVVAGSEQAIEGTAFVVSDGRIGNGLANAGDQLRILDGAGAVVAAISWGNNEEFSKIGSPTPKQSIQRSAPDAPLRLAAPTPGIVTAPSVQPTVVQNDGQAEATSSQPQATASTVAAATTTDNDTAAQATDATAPATTATTGATAATTTAAAPVLTVVTVPVVAFAEILPAPLSGQPEWVELVNLGPSAVDLSGWIIADAASETALEGIVPAGGRFVISTQTLTSNASVFVVNRIGNGLNNGGDTLRLLDPSGNVVDELAYGTDALPAPDRGFSIALEPGQWVVTAAPTPGSADVTPLIAEALRQPTTEASPDDVERLPLVAAPPKEGSNAWMIVTFALIGVILMLIVRRWTPPESAATAESTPASANYNGPPLDPSEPLERSPDP